MLKLFLFLVSFLCFSYIYAVEDELSFILLGYVPDTYQCSITKQSIKRGIYVDKLIINLSSPQNYTKKRLHYILTNDSDYIKEINNQMIFAWGNYDEKFALTSLNFMSMYDPEQIYHIQKNDIRGLAAKDNNLLFFTCREPPKLFSYNFSDKTSTPADIKDYYTNAENIGVRITKSGNIFLRGTGLENTQLSFLIPEKFIDNHAINCNTIWTLFANRKNHTVLFSSEGEIKNIIVGNPQQNQWNYFSIDSHYMDTKLFDNYLVFQPLSNNEKGRSIRIYNIDTNKHQQLVLPPFSKIIYFSSQYIIIAQPYRLLFVEYKKGNVLIRNCINFEEAWYIKMVFGESK